MGLHASFTVGDALLDDAVALARRHGTGLHLHVAEDPVDQERCLAEHGCRVVERLRAGRRARLAGHHPGPLPARGRARARPDHRRRSWVAINTESNQNNGVGRFTAAGLDPARLLLGTDGMHGDMLRSLQAAFLVGREGGGLAPELAWQALWNNRRYLEAHHPAAARTERPGRAGLPAADAARRTATSLGHALYGLDARHVRTVIAGGRVVLDEGRLCTIDEDETLRFCREQARRLWSAPGAVVDGAHP